MAGLRLPAVAAGRLLLSVVLPVSAADPLIQKIPVQEPVTWHEQRLPQLQQPETAEPAPQERLVMACAQQPQRQPPGSVVQAPLEPLVLAFVPQLEPQQRAREGQAVWSEEDSDVAWHSALDACL